MTPIQHTLFNIVEDISTKYHCFDDLLDDRFYKAWVKHIEDKKKTDKKIKKNISDREVAQQLKFERIPHYF